MRRGTASTDIGGAGITGDLDMTTTQPTLPFVAPKPFKRGTLNWRLVRLFVKHGWIINEAALHGEHALASCRQRFSEWRDDVFHDDDCVQDIGKHKTDANGKSYKEILYTVPVEFRQAMARLAEE